MVKIFECLISNVGDITCNFLRPQFGVTCSALKLGNMNRSVNIFFHDLLRDNDSILKVVSIPRHEGHKDVTSKCKFTTFGVRSISQHITDLDLISTIAYWALVQASTRIGTHELTQWISKDTFARITFNSGHIAEEFLIRNWHFTVLRGDDNLCCSSCDNTISFSGNDSPRILGGLCLKSGSYKWRIGNEKRHSLTLHVCTHECTVSIIVFEEWNNPCGYRDQLLGRNVHIFHGSWVNLDKFTTFTCSYFFRKEVSFAINRVVRLSDEKVFLLVSGNILDLVAYFSFFNTPIRCLNEPKLVNTCVGAEGVDQTNVWTLGSLNRADTSVVRCVNVSNFETGTVAVQTTRP